MYVASSNSCCYFVLFFVCRMPRFYDTLTAEKAAEKENKTHELKIIKEMYRARVFRCFSSIHECECGVNICVYIACLQNILFISDLPVHNVWREKENLKTRQSRFSSQFVRFDCICCSRFIYGLKYENNR